MTNAARFLLVVLAAYAYGLGARPLLCQRGRFGAACSLVAALGVLFFPLAIASEAVGLRALGAFVCAEIMFKMVDYARQFRSGSTTATRLGAYIGFLVPFPVLLVVFGRNDVRLPRGVRRWQEVPRVAAAAAVFASGFAFVYAVSGLAVVRNWFVVDHLIKFSIFLLTIGGLSRLILGLERLAGYDTQPLVRSAYLSRTVAEFWCRWNTRVHAWFELNVFRPSGGKRAPVRGVVASFVVSGIFHELMFGIATSRFDGYQLTFFVSQIPAVIASPRLARFARRRGWGGRAIVRSITVVWFIVTSALFFRGLARVFPFIYASEPWLP